jgi:fucose 4-O-acetylase-like acetyltransferase
MSSSRDLHFDGLKFLLVFLVVLGHLIYNDYGLGVKKMIFSFHMPAFIFISGYFTPLSANKEKQLEWLKKTFIILIVATIAQYMLRIMIDFSSSIVKDYSFQISSILNWRVLISPAYTLWYLVCLMYWRLLIWAVNDKLKDVIILAISCFAVICAGFIPLDYAFSFQRAFAFAPFFMLGVVFKKRQLINSLERVPVIFALIVLFLGLVIARRIDIYMPVRHFVTWKDLVLRIEQTLLGLFLCLSVIRISRCRFTSRFAKYGTKTLWVYIGHTYLIFIFNRVFHFLGVSFNLFSAIVLAILYCAFLVFIANMYQSYVQKRKSETGS